MLKEMFQTPESQKDPHYWGATLLGHDYIGSRLWALLVLTPFFMGYTIPAVTLGVVVAIGLMYLLLWEGLQFRNSNRSFYMVADSVLDAVGVGAGAWFAYSLWNHDLFGVLFSTVLTLLSAAAGVHVRRKKVVDKG